MGEKKRKKKGRTFCEISQNFCEIPRNVLRDPEKRFARSRETFARSRKQSILDQTGVSLNERRGAMEGARLMFYVCAYVCALLRVRL